MIQVREWPEQKKPPGKGNTPQKCQDRLHNDGGRNAVRSVDDEPVVQTETEAEQRRRNVNGNKGGGDM